MTKLNNEVIVAIAGAYEKIGQAHLEIAEYLKALANGFPSIDEVLPQEVTKEDTKDEVEAPVEVESGEEDVEEVSEDVAEEVEEADDEAEEVADDEEEAEEERSTIITVETEDGEEEIDLEEMSIKELKDFAEEYGLEVTTKTKSAIIEEILDQIYGEDEEAEEEVEDDVEDVEEDSEEDDGESDEDLAEMYGLNEMSLEELAEICAEHGLSTKGKRQALIDRIVRAIEDGTIEVEDEEEGE